MTSSIRPIFMPERARARSADWAPGPGVLVPLPGEGGKSVLIRSAQQRAGQWFLTSGGADLDVQGVDAELLAAGCDVLSSQHGSVGGGLVTVGLDLHATSNTGDGFTTAENQKC